jgi:hypothetical protein
MKFLLELNMEFGLFFFLCIVKRLQDKEKLKDFDKIKLQLEQLFEFKSRIMESQTSLQREVQRAKQEAREAIEARDTHAEEMADLAETVEMATLDKEMAEEKVRPSTCICIFNSLIYSFSSFIMNVNFVVSSPKKMYTHINRSYLWTSSKLNQNVMYDVWCDILPEMVLVT